MPIGRHRRYRSAVTATALLGMLFALLLCSPSYAGPADDVIVMTAQGQAPGCGKGAPDGDRGAHPATPPRGSAAYELLPAPHAAPCFTGPVLSAATPAITPDRAPPPPAPPTPVDLSVLRV
ncbi:hypothetical protein ACFQ6Q_19840 [Streptomyces sp. NPDC056437]|uniref:hypothetical protein n=1 Tax=Streptomyces sp. NPDC056437 TaxID=3345816 RepID=UPI0036CE029C